MLKSIDRQHFEHARTAFALLLVSRRPLKVEELAEAVVVSPYCKAIDIDDRLFDPKDIIRICRGLVTRVADTNEVRFAHYSVQEYLLSSRISYGSAAFFALSWAAADQKAAEICLTYLLSFDQPDSVYKDVLADYPFLSYAMYHWYDHVYLHRHDNAASLPSLCTAFSDAERNHAYANWISMLDYDVYYDTYYDIGNDPETAFEQPVNAMVAVGRLDIARTLLLDWRAWHSHGYDGDSVLQLAANSIDRHALQILIGSNSGISDESLPYPNLLNIVASDAELSSEVIHARVSSLARRSPILAQYWLRIALEAALNASHPQLVKIILEAGADVHVTWKDEDPVFVIAIRHCQNCDGVLEVVKMLLEHGADINGQSSAYGTALHVALGSDHSELARYLLNRGADTNLLEAAMSGGQELAAEFIKSGANVNATAGQMGTALQAATRTDNIEIMQLLIRSGADVNLAAPFDLIASRAYYQLCSRSDQELKKLNHIVRAMDRPPWSECSFGGQASPMAIACLNGNLEAVKLLLDSGASLKATEAGYTTPLSSSIMGLDWTPSRREIARLLINAGERLSSLESIGKSSGKPLCPDGQNAMPADRSELSQASLEHLSEEWHQMLLSALVEGSETQINDLVDMIIPT